ncbi:MAG: NAD(+) synthase [Candidatus Woesearchaeota archaeon]
MRIALAQMDVIPNRPDKNVEKMLVMIEDAKKNASDIIVFPELCISGYLLADKWTDENYCKDLMEYNSIIQAASSGIAIAYGNVYVDDNQKNTDGRKRKYNAVYIYQNTLPAPRLRENILPAGVQPKTLLPNYRIFDDERYFSGTLDVAMESNVNLESLLQPYLIEINHKNILFGFEICEDLWCEEYRRNTATLDVTKELIKNNAEHIINISASPWTYGKNAARDRRVKFLKENSQDYFVPFYYVNCVGMQNNGKNLVTFDGGSTVYDRSGESIQHSNKPYVEEILYADTDNFADTNNLTSHDSLPDTPSHPPLNALHQSLPKASLPKARIEQSLIAQKAQAIIEGIRHIKYMTGSTQDPRIVIGLSGGIDSAISAALISLAIGPDKILGINMPSVYNSAKTRHAAAYVAEKLSIAYQEIPIQDIVDVQTRIIDSCDADGSGRTLNELNLENLQAKVRATSILSNIAAKYGALFTNNGNKLETALGYATLYGDVGGAFAPIGDLLKTEIFEMARYLNDEIFHNEVIPRSLIPDSLYRFGKDQIAPSAELKNDQIDPMKFGYHDALLARFTDYNKVGCEDVMQWYLSGTLEKELHISSDLIKRWDIDHPHTFIEDLEWFSKSITTAVFKRVQSPPIIITSKSSYGYDIRESILPVYQSKAYGRLRKKVLAMSMYRSSDQSSKNAL